MSNTNSSNFMNRVFGITMVRSTVSNYNADFTKQPRTLPSGTIYATDKALKYTIKHLIKKYYEQIEIVDGKENVERKHNRVMYFRNYDSDMKPRTLGETYKKMFGDFPKKPKEAKGKANAANNEFFVFYFNGNETKGFLNEKLSNSSIKEYFKAVEHVGIERFGNQKYFENIFKGKKKKIEDIIKSISKEEEDTEERFFYYNKEGVFTRFDGEIDDIKIVIKELDDLITGGFDKYAILKNLLKCIDVRLFGSTFADETNISIHGPLQVTHGIDRSGKNSELRFSEQIMSPFRNSNEKSIDNDATTLGTQFQLEEGHYVHQFSINPSNLNTHNQNLKDEEKVFIDDSDIEILKEGLKKGVTDYDSASKKGSENELFLWIELKRDSKLVLPNMQFLIDVNFEKKAGRSVIDLTKVVKLLENLPKKKKGNDAEGKEIREEETQIFKIKLGYNDAVTEVKGLPESNTIQGVSIEITGLI
jgi:CRISPR/Cas system type I-B associated protein Csh2 (Cas7 group RAMP superfamily)